MNSSNVSCIIPFFATRGTEQRIKNTEFLLKWLIEVHGYKDLEIIICQQYKEKPTEYPFFYRYDNVKHITVQKNLDLIYYSWLINYAVKQTSRDYVIVADADAICDLRPSLNIIENHDLVLPYNKTHCLDEKRSEEFIRNGNLQSINHIQKYDSLPIHWSASIIGAYIFLTKKSSFLDIGGFDEDAVGWGDHDNILSIKIKAFLDYKVIPNIVLHLHHLIELDYGNKNEKIEHINHNRSVLEKVQSMNKEELKHYIDLNKDKIGI